jgi:hypothetical protein
MNIYFWCPYFRTGGPESLHQWCQMSNSHGVPSYMYYLDASDVPHPSAVKLIDTSPVLFSEYSLVKRAFEVEDENDNIMFIPEIVPLADVRKRFKKIRIVVAWLSITSGLPLLDHYLESPDVTHVFQSFRARRDVLARANELGLKEPKWFDMSDFINLEFQQTWDLLQKKNQIAWNPVKDRISGQLGLPHVPLIGMSRPQLVESLKQSKVYVDCGGHPGRDRMPREAALLGCIVVTNTQGTAECFEDVPIKTKANSYEDLFLHINNGFENYDDMLREQESWVQTIINDRDTCSKQVKTFLKSMEL